MRDINLESTIFPRFTTRTYATGVPATLSGSPVLSVYEENNLSQITAGVSVAVDYDTVTGLNQATIVATAANGYEAGKSYDLVITTGTVSGVSVVGVVVASFTVEDSAIGMNALARAALEDQYDGTGLTGDTYPANQAQVGNIATGSSAISTIASGQTLTTGTEVNDYTDTATKNGIYHEISDVAGAMEIVYDFDVGGSGVASEVSMWGRLNSANDTIGVFAYNWVGASWDQIGTMIGQGGTTDGFISFNLLTRNTGTGANLGQVRIRGFAASGLTSSTLYIDQAFVSFAVVSQSAGYANGAIWIDTVAGTAGTEVYVNGVADNPCLTLADANTIESILGLDRFELSPDSSITFVSTQDSEIFRGKGYTVALGGQDLTGSTIIGATISGIATTSGDEIHLVDCEMEACTLGAAHLQECGLISTLILSDAATYTLQTCYSKIAGSGSPTIDFGAAVGNTALNMRRYSGGIEIQNMGQVGVDTMSLEGNGALTVNANCVGGTIVLRGDFSVINNGSTTITYDDNTSNIQATLADTNELQTDWANGGRLDVIQDAILVDTADMQPRVTAIEVDTNTTIPAKIDSLGVKKNTPFSNYEFLMVLTADHVTPATGLTVTGQRSINGGVFVALTGAIAEVSNGIYQFDALAADTNGDTITWRFSSASADDVFETFTTIA